MESNEEFSYSSDKQERQNIRKKRIENNNSSDNGLNQEIKKKIDINEKTGLNQISESLNNLDKRKIRSIRETTATRVIFEEFESNRRIEDEEVRRERLNKLQQEALSSAKANAAVEMKWAELLEKSIPQELYHEIQTQMTDCNTIIKSKDQLIKEFQNQLRAKDEEYIKVLHQHDKEIDEVLSKVRSEFRLLGNEYETELNKIEEAFLEERERIITENANEIENLFEQRKNKEMFYKESKQKREEQYQKEIDDLLAKGSDQYTKLKIELELNIQTLKEQLEEIRATYQLNTEKLDYNYRVLTELDVEKHAELGRYKRKENKLKDQFNQLINKYAEAEAADAKLNNELTEDYRSLTQKYKDLQSKFRQFEIADTGKFDEVWAMHEDAVNDLLDQLLKADKIITEQQLGLTWQQPDTAALQNVLSRFSHVSIALAASTESVPGTVNDNQQSSPNPNTEHNKVPGAKVRAVLKLLASEAGFLVNSEVQKAIELLPDDEADLSRAEAMLRVLGVKNEDKLKVLVSYFFKDTAPNYNIDEVDESKGLSYDNNASEELEALLHSSPGDMEEIKEIIEAEKVIAAVKTFIEDMTIDGSVRSTIGIAGGKSTEDDARIGQKRLNTMRKYWNQLSQVVPDESTNVWKQLEANYSDVKELLNKRSQAVQEVDHLNRRNIELKKLLNQYLGDSNINDNLQVPPSQIMRVRNPGNKLPKSKI